MTDENKKPTSGEPYVSFSEFSDLYVSGFLEDLPMYQHHAERTGGPVLEIGAGSGRMTIPLAQKGFEVAAMDISPTMLEILRDRMAEGPEEVRDWIQVIQADICDLDMGGKFGLVMVPY